MIARSLAVLLCVAMLACAPTPSPSDASPTATTPSESSLVDRPKWHPARAPVRRKLARTMPQVPVVPETRSAVDLARAACPPGRCVGTNLRTPMAASAAVPLIPTPWTVPLWEVDPASASGCASNSNSGTSATCVGGCTGSVCPSGIGPLLSCQEIETHRWGCNGVNNQCARLRQTTTIEWISDTTDTSDVCYFAPAVENAANFIQRGVPTTVCSGTLANRTAKAHPAQLLQFNLCAGAAVDLYVLNTTRGSGAWIDANVAGTTWKLSQPLPTFSIPWNGVDPPEDDTWTNGDSYVVQSFPGAFLPVQAGTLNDASGATAAGVYIQHLRNKTTGAASRMTGFGSSTPVFLVESRIDRLINLEGTWEGLNSDATNSVTMSHANAFFGDVAGWKAGIIRQGVASGVSMFLEAGTIVTGSPGTDLNVFNGQLNDVFIDTGVNINLTGANTANTYTGNSDPFIWGPGGVDALAPANLFINANTAAPTLLMGSIGMDALSTACTQTNAAPSVVNCGVTISAANIDANSGFMVNPAGISISTLSSPF